MMSWNCCSPSTTMNAARMPGILFIYEREKEKLYLMCLCIHNLCDYSVCTWVQALKMLSPWLNEVIYDLNVFKLDCWVLAAFFSFVFLSLRFILNLPFSSPQRKKNQKLYESRFNFVKDNCQWWTVLFFSIFIILL